MEGLEIVYGCIENYVSEGDLFIFCKDNGLWIKLILYCRCMLFKCILVLMIVLKEIMYYFFF